MTQTINAGKAAAGSSFYAGMRVLPKAEREAMYAVYGFCRIVDDIADDQQGHRDARMAELDAWRHDLDSLYAGGAPGRAALVADAVRRFGLERADFEAVIDGMATDVDHDVRWPTWDELDLYCDRVASAVGRLSVRVFGMDRAAGLALAHHLGRALQFTNILRDIDEDAAIGRVYLPAEALTEAGIALTTPREVAADPRIDAVARQVAVRAQEHFRQAHAVLAARPRGHLIAPRLMDAVYARILQQMLQVGWAPPRRRIKTNKLLLVATVLWLLVKN
ncbi:squalene synthase HpnD [Novosphingobium nitrogenifigens DSM 19370]|uniref:Squalene synthase HpnD n=1 Tax=Novosphingobium nitrogenifigens DSM 19370 TaxID=983920 RepID=F1Z7H2_9SPHN|nr:presqualene diphosphate synthase HpnD [Novosphingobium nitrogenifigens]EGD59484.1 squalene synthase HpnD [Novosphingobium nitrogenifigens DSM 19370]